MLDKKERLDVLVQLGHYLQLKEERLMAFVKRTAYKHKWFTEEQHIFAMDNISKNLLNRPLLEKWMEKQVEVPSKKIGIISNNDAPLSYFQDVLCSFVLGHHTCIQLQEDDCFLFPFLIKKMEDIKIGVENYFSFPDTFPFKEMDAIIASGKKELTQHYKKYFKQPLLIRNPRRAVAIIDGNESKKDFQLLVNDVLPYFGRSSKNVGKLFIPKGYDFNLFLETFHEHNAIIRYNPYKNNYEYQISLLILNKVFHWNNGSVIVAKDNEVFSPISVLNFEEYDSKEDLAQKIKSQVDNIHHIASQTAIEEFPTKRFGQGLIPSLDSFENNINTLHFLQQINA